MITNDLAKNKLIILYIINSYAHCLVESELNYLVLNMELFNYFYFKDCLSQMETSGLILFDNNKKYYLSDQGERTLEALKKEVPTAFIEKLKNNREDFVKYRNENSSIAVDISEENGTSYCNMSIKDGNVPVMILKIEVSDHNMANTVASNFKRRAQKIYMEILNLLNEG